MSKQAKAVKKKKAGKKRAEEIIKEAKAKRVSPPTATAVSDKWADERIDGCTDEQWALAVRCRELREEGEPWWAIARALELEGYGDSATTGKKGAARARNVYKAGFGSFPRTFETGRYKGPVERNERVREMKKQKQAERKAIARAGKSVLDPALPDEEIADMLRGRKIKWYSTSLIPEGMDYEATVHPRATLYIYEENGEKVVEFREQHRKAPPGIRELPAHIRTVRIRQIYSIK